MGDIVKEVVGTSFALTVGLSDRQQITFQSGFADDESDDGIHARIDRLTAIARRSQLLAELPDLIAERTKLLDQQAQTVQDEIRIDAEWQKTFDEITARKENVFEVGYSEHARGGRQGAYEPRGAAKQAIMGCEKELERMQSERDVAMQSRAAFHRQIEMRVKAIDEKLAEADKLKGS